MEKTSKHLAAGKTKKHPVVWILLYIAAAVALTVAPWAASSVQAADQRSSSGSSRPLMPGNQPAGTGLNQPVPGSDVGTHPQRPATPATPPNNTPPATSVPPGSAPSSGLSGQGTVKGSTGAPGSVGDPAGGTAGSRGAKDSRYGH